MSRPISATAIYAARWSNAGIWSRHFTASLAKRLSRLVRQYMAEHGDRIVRHYLPAYSPQDNRRRNV